MSIDSSSTPEGSELSEEERSWRTANASMDDAREKQAADHRERYMGKRATVTWDISTQDHGEVATLARKGETVDIVDADCNRHVFRDVKVRTTEGREEWVDSMHLRVI